MREAEAEQFSGLRELAAVLTQFAAQKGIGSLSYELVDEKEFGALLKINLLEDTEAADAHYDKRCENGLGVRCEIHRADCQCCAEKPKGEEEKPE